MIVDTMHIPDTNLTGIIRQENNRTLVSTIFGTIENQIEIACYISNQLNKEVYAEYNNQTIKIEPSFYNNPNAKNQAILKLKDKQLKSENSI